MGFLSPPEGVQSFGHKNYYFDYLIVYMIPYPSLISKDLAHAKHFRLLWLLGRDSSFAPLRIFET